MTEHITVSREPLRQVRVVTQRARYTAMNQTLVARIPESGLFGGIAQDLDFAESKLRAVLEQPVVEPVAEASVLELVDQLKAGAAFPAYPPMPLREAASVLLKQHEAIRQLREALRGMVALEGEGLRGNDDINICYEHREALQALQDTEGFV